MKKDTLIFVLAILILTTAGFLYHAKPLHVSDAPVKTVDENLQKICYLTHITTAAGEDNTYLEVSLADSGLVSGRFNLLPAEKDKLTGPFLGNWTEAGSALMLDVMHTYTAEGITTQEKRVFRLTETGADISWDGGKTFTQTLPQVECEDVSEDVVKGR